MAGLSRLKTGTGVGVGADAADVKGSWQNLEDPSGETVLERGEGTNYMAVLSRNDCRPYREGLDKIPMATATATAPLLMNVESATCPIRQVCTKPHPHSSKVQHTWNRHVVP
jgi:hypothetical protein